MLPKALGVRKCDISISLSLSLRFSSLLLAKATFSTRDLNSPSEA
uniref:Uncharacterized protein n=1 Tax=Rhizophora mucronata TaxID=61149 RepID=A0A2P2QU60_RHIMU